MTAELCSTNTCQESKKPDNSSLFVILFSSEDRSYPANTNKCIWLGLGLPFNCTQTFMIPIGCICAHFGVFYHYLAVVIRKCFQCYLDSTLLFPLILQEGRVRRSPWVWAFDFQQSAMEMFLQLYMIILMMLVCLLLSSLSPLPWLSSFHPILSVLCLFLSPSPLLFCLSVSKEYALLFVPPV